MRRSLRFVSVGGHDLPGVVALSSSGDPIGLTVTFRPSTVYRIVTLVSKSSLKIHFPSSSGNRFETVNGFISKNFLLRMSERK